MKVSVIVAVQMVALATLVRGDVNTKMQNMLNKMPGGAAGMMNKMAAGAGAQMQEMMKHLPECAQEKMKGMMAGATGGAGAGAGAGGMVDMAMMPLDANCDGKLTKEELEKMSKMPGGGKGPASVDSLIKIADQPDCDGVLSKEEFGDFIKMDPTQKATDGKLSKEALGDDETWKTLEASGKIKDGHISVKDYIAYKVTAAKCNAASLTAALSMLGFVLVAKILF